MVGYTDYVNIERTIKMLRLLRVSTEEAIAVNAILKMRTFSNDGETKGVALSDIDAAAECGTVCCLAGWAGYNKEFQEVHKLHHALHPEGYSQLMIGDKLTGMSSLRNLFGIENSENYTLFGMDGTKDRRVITGKDHSYTLEDMLSVVDHFINLYVSKIGRVCIAKEDYQLFKKGEEYTWFSRMEDDWIDIIGYDTLINPTELRDHFIVPVEKKEMTHADITKALGYEFILVDG